MLMIESMTSKIINFSNNISLKISKDRVVTLTYAVLDYTNNDLLEYKESICYLHGGYEPHLQKLQESIEGFESGAKTEITLEPEQAFGPHLPHLIMTADADQFPPHASKLWSTIEGESETGEIINFTVIKVENNQITVDGNHPFAGKRLKFVVEITDVRNAKAEEIKQGFVNKQQPSF